MEKIIEMKTVRVRKTMISSTFFNKLKFQGDCCKSCIDNFAYRELLEITQSLSGIVHFQGVPLKVIMPGKLIAVAYTLRTY